MKNLKRAAAWILTVLMVLGCLPLSAMAEGVVTDNSPALAAVDLLDGSRSVEGGGDGITFTSSTTEEWYVTVYRTNWTIPVYLYAENDNGTPTYLTSGTITKASSYSRYDNNPASFTVSSDSTITNLLSQYNYSEVKYLLGSSPTTGTEVSSITLSTTSGGGTTFNYGTPLATDQYANNAIFVVIKREPITVTVSGNGIATLTSDYTTTYVESESAVTIKLPEQNQTINNNSDAYTITGWKDSTGTGYSFGQTVKVTKSTDFVPVANGLHTITFIQNTDRSGSGKKSVMYVADGAYLTFPELYSGWEVEGSIFVGWSTDAQGDEQVYDQSTNGVFSPNTQWVSGADEPITVESDKTFYAIWIDPDREELTTAQFAIRLDGIMPFEPTDHGEGGYGSSMRITNALKSPTSVINNVAAVRENLAAEPTLEQVYNSINGKSHVYGSNLRTQNDDGTYTYNFEVRWYVIKKLRDTPPWHVDGIIVPVSYYTVYYDANGGTNAPGSAIFKAKANVDVNLKDLPSRAGYIFKGWAETADATTPKYATGGTTSFTMPANDVTLYAVWEADGNTPYKVEHYLQQASDAGYKLEKEENLKGDTDSLVSAVPATFEGYTVDYSIAGTLAAGKVIADDSSTDDVEMLVLKLYYTRDTGSLTLKKVYKGIESSQGVEFVLSGFTSKDYGRAVQGGNKTIGTDGTVTITVPATEAGVILTDIPTGTITVSEVGESGGKAKINGMTFDVSGGGSVTVTKGGSATATITNTLSTTSVEVTKIWNDESNAYDTRPAQITVKLMNGTEVVSSETVDVGTADSQTIIFSGVPIYDRDGNTITYTVAEDAVAGYGTVVDGLEITNTLKTYSLNVIKEVSGNAAETTIPFDFSAVLLKGDGSAAPVNFTNAGSYTANGSNGVNFTLKHGESVKLEGIPYGYKVEVTETPFDLYVASNSYPKDDNGSVAMVGAFTYENAEATVTFTNTFNVSLPTGVDLDGLPYTMLLLGAAGLGLVWLLLARRRRNDD